MTVSDRGLVPMRARDPRERGRSASTLELFFDLVFVIAVSVASAQLAGFEERGAVLQGAGAYLFVFFLICWAWVNFAWFASAFDTDDWLYRVTTVVQMAGVLVLAGGLPAVMHGGDVRIATLGYVIMRLAMVGQWLRAATDRSMRRTALRYAGSIAVLQLLWVARLALPTTSAIVATVILSAGEVLVPVWAEQAGGTSFHPRHITERFGQFTLIVLGEGLLGVAMSVFALLRGSVDLLPLTGVAASALVIVAGMWWISFARDQHEHLGSFSGVLAFGYLHCVVFATAGAVGARFETVAHAAESSGDAVEPGVVATVTVPVAVFLLVAWWLAIRGSAGRAVDVAMLLLVVLTAAATAVPFGSPSPRCSWSRSSSWSRRPGSDGSASPGTEAGDRRIDLRSTRRRRCRLGPCGFHGTLPSRPSGRAPRSRPRRVDRHGLGSSAVEHVFASSGMTHRF